MKRKWNEIGAPAAKFFKKYKYPLLVLLLGVALLLWPSSSTKGAMKHETREETQTTTPTITSNELGSMEARISAALSQIEGAGQVSVILTLKTGTEYLYQFDTTCDLAREGDSTKDSTSNQTVVITTGSGQEEPVLRTTVYPTFQGAVVIAAGAGSPTVKLELVKAVANLTGLGVDQISVVKRK